MAVVENRVYTLSTTGLEVLDGETGQRIWTKTNTGKYHSTPAVCDGRVYLYDGASTLSCLSAEDGEVLWWQAASNHVTGYLVFSDASLSPLVADGRVIVLARGQTNTVMAFNSTNGTLIWKGHKHGMTHASPNLASFSGVPQILCHAAPNQLVSISPEDGRVLWTFSNSGIYTTPVPCGESLIGAEQGRLLNVAFTSSGWTVTQAWYSPNLLTSWSLPVSKDGYIYDIFSGALKCVRLSNGILRWSTNGFGQGSVIMAGRYLVAVAEAGTVYVANANPLKFDLVGSIRPLTNNCINLPAVVDGRIYVRNEKAVACIDYPSWFVVGELVSKKPSGYSLVVRAADGSPLSAARVSRITLRGASTVNPLGGMWSPLGPPVYPRFHTNGILVYSNLPGPPWFFRIFETNAP
jgi:outer membrane protein assembly factor BamB